MSPALPTIVLVHGAWHTPPIYQSFIDALQAKDFTVHCPRLPSCDGTSPPTASLAEDISSVRDLVSGLVSSNQQVLMLMHSYSGIVGTEAIEGLTSAPRAAKGLSGGVIHLVYLCAYMLSPGGSVWGIVEEAGFAPLWDQYIENFEDGTCFVKDPTAAFFNVVGEDTTQLALRHSVRHPLSAYKTKTKGSAWRTVPATYVLTSQDVAVSSVYQDLMLRRVKADGVDLKVVEYDTGHSIFLTLQDAMVKLVAEAVNDQRNAK